MIDINAWIAGGGSVDNKLELCIATTAGVSQCFFYSACAGHAGHIGSHGA
jgi:hypothetical protein